MNGAGWRTFDLVLLLFIALAIPQPALASGEAYAFGQNSSGELGLGGYTERNTPTKIPGISGAVAVSAGYIHSSGTPSKW